MDKKWTKSPILVTWMAFRSCYVEICNCKKRLGKIDGAEGETRTRMGLLPLDPESSEWVFAIQLKFHNYLNFIDFVDIHNIQKNTRYTQYTE